MCPRASPDANCRRLHRAQLAARDSYSYYVNGFPGAFQIYDRTFNFDVWLGTLYVSGVQAGVSDLHDLLGYSAGCPGHAATATFSVPVLNGQQTLPPFLYGNPTAYGTLVGG